VLSAIVGLIVAAQAWYFTACVTVNLPDDDRSDSETQKLQSRVNRHNEVSAIFQKHGQSSLALHRDNQRRWPPTEEKAKKTLAQTQGPAPTLWREHPLVIPHMAQFNAAELDQIASIVAQESKEMAFSEPVELENVETKEITRTVGAKGEFVRGF